MADNKEPTQMFPVVFISPSGQGSTSMRGDGEQVPQRLIKDFRPRMNTEPAPVVSPKSPSEEDGDPKVSPATGDAGSSPSESETSQQQQEVQPASAVKESSITSLGLGNPLMMTTGKNEPPAKA